MNILKKGLLAIFAVALVGVFSSEVNAQDKRAAVLTYNEAQELAKNKQYEESIAKFQEAIAIAQKLGAEGSDIVTRSKDKLPGVYFDIALNDYRTFQGSQTVSNLEATIASFKKAAEVGDQYGNSAVAEKARGAIPKLMYGKASLQYKQGNNEAALTTINQIIESNPDYATAYYQKALILKKTASFADMIAMLDKAIEVAEANNNSKVSRLAKEKASAELISRGGNLVNSKDYTGAIEALNSAIKYAPESADAHYWLAKAYNSRGEWDQALNYGQKAVALENGGRTTKAKIYFEIATAYKGQGNYDNACNNFSNAAYGQFRQSAQHQMEYVLKCETSTN